MSDNVAGVLAGLLLDRKIRYFTATELLYLGNSHYNSHDQAYGLNELLPINLVDKIAAIAVVADELRQAFGAPLRVLSAYRCPRYNRALIGTASQSYHIKGMALDLAPQANQVHRLHNLALLLHKSEIWRGGLGIYSWGVHIDTGPQRQW